MYDLAIIGGGPAGVAAGVYAARKKLKTVFITFDFNSQSSVSLDVQNWIGTVSLSGLELAENLKKHLKAYSADTVFIKEGEKAISIIKAGENFAVKTDKGEYSAKTVLIATGSKRRQLEAKGADVFENKGITYCASCDGPLFADKDTVVIGGGNAGFETAAQLLAYAKSVTLIHRSAEFRADPVTVEKVLKNPKMKALKNIETLEVKGDKFVKSIVIKDANTGKITELPTEGIFVEIGLVPNTDYVANLVKLDQYKRIPIDTKNQQTSVKGVWAAGDCTDILYHQNNIAAGDGVKALEDIYMYLHAK
ncbi:MAG: FAD-dependent oxidoreductase [Patescibacteria group bacterium]